MGMIPVKMYKHPSFVLIRQFSISNIILKDNVNMKPYKLTNKHSPLRSESEVENES